MAKTLTDNPQNNHPSNTNKPNSSFLKEHRKFVFTTVFVTFIIFSLLNAGYVLLTKNFNIIGNTFGGFGIALIEFLLISFTVERVATGAITPKRAKAEAVLRLLVVAGLLIYVSYKATEQILPIIGFLSGFILIRAVMIGLHYHKQNKSTLR